MPRYDYAYLTSFCEENNITLCNDYSNEKVNARTIINGKCKTENCNNIFSKSFISFNRTKDICFECTKNLAKIKLKSTWLEKYGVEHITKLDSIKNKIKQTCIQKYGSSCSLQNKEVDEKSKQTCMEKYGTEYCLQSDKIKEKIKETCLKKYGSTCYLTSEGFKTQYKEANLEKYGTENYARTQESKDKYKQTCLNKYGVDSYSKTDKFKKDRKETLVEKYGVDSYSKTEEYMKKYKETCLERYGKESYLQSDLHKQRTIQSSIQKFGVNHYTKTDDFKERYKTTCLSKYGVENSSQNHNIMEKIIKGAYKQKEFKFLSGRIEIVQGAEPFALRDLIDIEHIDENDIVVGCKNVPTIWYNDINGKKHRHYVDIFIKSQNRCIEIKSEWTKSINEHNIFLKQKAGKELGYKYEIWVYNGKGIRIEKLE